MDEKTVVPPFAVDDVQWESWSEGVRFGSRAKRLSDHGGGSHLGVVMEELDPGHQSCPLHYHLFEEEHILALAGSATLRLGDQSYPITAGDYVCFPAGQKLGHALINDGDQTFRFLIIGERLPHEVCVYPDSQKILISSTKALYRLGTELDYWDQESADKPLGLPPET